MFRILMVAASLLIVASRCAVAADEDPKDAKTRIVLIGHKPDHPFGSHMYLHECGLLAKCLNQTAGVEAVVSDGWPKDPNVLEGVDALVFYSSPGGNLLLAAPHAKQAEQLLADGIGLSALHWGTGATDGLGERYLRVLGGWFDTSFGGLDVVPTKLEKLGTDHPISRGWDEFMLRDEIYLKTRLAPEAKPLLKVDVKGAEQMVGWIYERPDSKNGRSFGLTLGHFHDNFGIDEFRRVIVNGILWTAHVEIPASGAPVRVSAQDLDVGPPPDQKTGK